MAKTIGLIGVKGAGKDTCASVLVEKRNFIRVAFADALYDEVANAFAVSKTTFGNRATKETPIPELALRRCKNKEFIEVALVHLTRDNHLRKAALTYILTGKLTRGVSNRKTKQLAKEARSPRWTMQKWGTEYRRRSQYGVDSYWLDLLSEQISANPEANHVVTDVRFLNEVRFIEARRGTLVRVRRPELERLEHENRLANGTAAHCSETELLDARVDFEVLNVEGNEVGMHQQILGYVDRIL